MKIRMLSRCALLLLCIVPFAMSGCSDGNTSAPVDSNAHPLNWLQTHPTGALATPNFAGCVGCHAGDLQGRGEAVSCYSCHVFNADRNFVIHPINWTDAYTNHRSFAIVNGTATCANCHGAELRGSAAAPSCFSSTFDGLNCHSDGPGQSPHPLDGTFLQGSVHGPVAKMDLVDCQGCHGQIGGPGTNPRFNIGIDRVGGTGCESCHGVNLAHPGSWAPLNHASAGNIQGACTLCHGTNLDGVNGVGVSCLDCHSTNPAANPTGCASCHNQPPNGATPGGNVSPNRNGQHDRVGHAAWINDTPSLTCVRCHSNAGSGTAVHADGVVNVNLLNTDPSDTISVTFDGANTTCTGACHISRFGFSYNHDNRAWY